MRLITDEQHAQIVEALKVSERNNPDPVLVTHYGIALATLQSLVEVKVVGYVYSVASNPGEKSAALPADITNGTPLYATKEPS